MNSFLADDRSVDLSGLGRLGKTGITGLAREQLLTDGHVPSGILRDEIVASWQRSVECGVHWHDNARLDLGEFYSLPTLEEKNRVLLDAACADLGYLGERCGASGLVILTDAQATILSIKGRLDDSMGIRDLAPGAPWSEALRGTNALGTALVDACAVTIDRGEHFLEGLGRFSCCALPIQDPLGAIAGVLDLSRGESLPLAHDALFSLVCAAAHHIEIRLFEAGYPEHFIVAFHPQAAWLDTPWHGVLAVQEDGEILAANQQACELLGLARVALTGRWCEPLDGLRRLSWGVWGREGAKAGAAREAAMHVAGVKRLFGFKVLRAPRAERAVGVMDAMRGAMGVMGAARAADEMRAPRAVGADQRAGAQPGQSGRHDEPDRKRSFATPCARALDAQGQSRPPGSGQRPARVAPMSAPVSTPPTPSTPSTPQALQTPQVPQASRASAIDDETCPLAGFAGGQARLLRALQMAREGLNNGLPVLLQGETGTGKEVAARTLHETSRRSDKPFVVVNCASIPEGLIESELFGYRAGAFTGARKGGMVGRMAQAHGGTLFLDEIGDMPLPLQARLLRVLQERKVAPLGASDEQAIDIAVICATHRDLPQMVREKGFREDLYYRINGVGVRLPALRERDDIGRIALRLLEKSGAPHVRISAELARVLYAYTWPGNIRQLEMVLRTALAMGAGQSGEIGLKHLSDEFVEFMRAGVHDDIRDTPGPHRYAGLIRQHENELIRENLARYDGNVGAAAQALGISRATLYRRLKRLRDGG